MQRLLTALSLAAGAQLCVAAPPAPSPAPVKLTVDAAKIQGR